MSVFIEVHCDISFVCFYPNPAGTLILTRNQSDFRAFAFIMLSAGAVFYNQICACTCVCVCVCVCVCMLACGEGGTIQLSIIDHILQLLGLFPELAVTH